MAADRELEKYIRERRKAYDKGDLNEVATICNNIGLLYTQKGDHEKALQYHREELSLSESLNDLLGQAVGHRKVGECLADLCQFSKALKEEEKYLNIVLSLNQTEEIQRAYATIGRIWYMRYKSECKGKKEESKGVAKYLDKSHQSFQYGLETCQELVGVVNKKELSEMTARLHLNLGLIAEERDDIITAEREYQKTTELAKECNCYSLVWQSLYNFSELLINARHSNRALVALEDSLKYAELSKNKTHRASSLLQIAMVHVQLVDFPLAKKYLKSSLKLNAWNNEDYQTVVRKYKLICKILSLLSDAVSCSIDQRIILYDKLGDICCNKEFGFYNAAIKYYKMELQLAEDHGYEMTQLSDIYYSLAATYTDNGQYNEALDYHRKELNMWQGHPPEEASTWTNIARVHEAANQKPEALEAYSTAIQLASQTYLVLGDVYRSLISFCESQSNLTKETAQYQLKYESLLKDHPEMISNPSVKLERSQEATPLSSQDLKEELVLSSSESEDEENVGLTDYTQTTRQLRGVAVRKKAKHSIRNEKGETPLHVAAINGNITRVQQLLDDGADVNVRDYCGWTPLHEACNHGNLNIVECLLNHSAVINDGGGKDCNNTTPLMDAATNGHVGVVTLLIDRGADLSIRNDKGDTALGLVMEVISNAHSYDEDYYSIKGQLIEAMKERGLHTLIKEATRKRDRGGRDGESGRKGCEERGEGYRMISSSPETPVAIVRPLPRIDSNHEQPAALISISSDDDLLTDNWLLNDMEENQPPNKKRKSRTSGSGQKAINKQFHGCGQRSLKRQSSGCDQNHLSKRKTNPVIIEEEGSNDVLYSDPPTQSYIPPTQSYIPPTQSGQLPNQAFIPPTQSYQPPTQSYQRPNQAFIPPTQSYQPPTHSYQPPTQSYIPPTQLYQPPTMLRVKVCLESDIFLIPCPWQQEGGTSTNIEWLLNTASERYYRQYGRRPVLSLTTSEGALLCLSDSICDVLQEGDELVGVVKHWETPPLHQHYQSICKDFNTSVHPKVLQMFQTTSSSTLSFTNYGLLPLHFPSLFHTLLAHHSLTSLNLSGNHLTDTCVNYLIQLLSPSSSCSLHQLDLTCTGLTEHGLLSLAQSLTTPTGVQPTSSTSTDREGGRQLTLKSLKLSHNNFGPYCGSSLSLLLSLTPSLSHFELNDCGLTDYTMEEHTGLVRTFNQLKFLQEISLDCNSQLNGGISTLEDIRLISLSVASSLSSFFRIKLSASLLHLNLSCCLLKCDNLSSLSSLTCLQSLNLSGNTITNNQELQSLAKSLLAMKDLRKLDISGNHYIGSSNGLMAIIESTTTTLETLLLMDCHLCSPLSPDCYNQLALLKLNKIDVRVNPLLQSEDLIKLKDNITTVVV